MKSKARMFASVLVILMLGSVAFGAPTFQPGRDVSNPVPGEILVGFKADVTPDQIDAAVKAAGGIVLGKTSFPRTKIVRLKLVSDNQEAKDQAISSLKANDLVKYAEPHVKRWAHGTRNPGGGGVNAQAGDPLLYAQWGYYDIGANWVSPPSGTTSPLVAVVDTGVDYTHPDLVGRVVKGYDFVNADADPMDDYGHGTHVSGIIAAAANNGYGIAGVGWKSKILAIKALNSQGWGTDWEIAQAIKFAVNNAAVKVINMSLGGGYSSTEEEAVNYAVVTKKKLLVASAGNDYSDIAPFPAGFADPVAYPEFAGRVLAVAAHDVTQCKADFSNYGTWVSITAPGVDVLSTVPPSLGYTGFDSWSGTSMSAPHVTGAAAAAWERSPSLSNTQVAALITQNNAAFPGFELVRDDVCWPADGSTFDRLDLMHMFEADYFEDPETTTRSFIYGFAFNAENGEPLAGAKVTAKRGATVAGTDYVSYYGERTYFYPDNLNAAEGYGLFSVLTESGTNSVKLKKAGFSPSAFTGLDVLPDSGYYLGNIPVPPNSGKYWLAVTWDNFYSGALYDSYLSVPDYDWISYLNVGDLSGFPWAKVLWDSDDLIDQIYGTRRAFSEVIRIKKTVSGDYWYYIDDWWNGAGSTSWFESGIKVYIFRWDPVTLTPKLVKTYTPDTATGDAGEYWDICTITGNNINDINNITD